MYFILALRKILIPPLPHHQWTGFFLANMGGVKLVFHFAQLFGAEGRCCAFGARMMLPLGLSLAALGVSAWIEDIVSLHLYGIVNSSQGMELTSDNDRFPSSCQF